MTAQQVGVWTRRAFLRGLALAGAVGVFGMYPKPVAAVDEPPMRGPTGTPSALGVCPPRDANAHELCPNCCNYRDEAM
jgi:hypothetical protein